MSQSGGTTGVPSAHWREEKMPDVRRSSEYVSLLSQAIGGGLKVLEDMNVIPLRQPVLRDEFSARLDEACYLVADMFIEDYLQPKTLSEVRNYAGANLQRMGADHVARNLLQSRQRSHRHDWYDFADGGYQHCEEVLASGAETLEELETLLESRKISHHVTSNAVRMP